jgi:hypothetical protein
MEPPHESCHFGRWPRDRPIGGDWAASEAYGRDRRPAMISHIMKICLHFGVIEFVICLGYKGDRINEHFANFGLHMSDVTADMRTGGIG